MSMFTSILLIARRSARTSGGHSSRLRTAAVRTGILTALLSIGVFGLFAQPGEFAGVPVNIINGGNCYGSGTGCDPEWTTGTREIELDDYPGCIITAVYQTRQCKTKIGTQEKITTEVWVTRMEIPDNGPCTSLRDSILATNVGIGQLWHEAHMKIAGKVMDDAYGYEADYRCPPLGTGMVTTSRSYNAACARYETVTMVVPVRRPVLETLCVNRTWCCPPEAVCPPDMTTMGNAGIMDWVVSQYVQEAEAQVNGTPNQIIYSINELYLGFTPYSYRSNLTGGPTCWQFDECTVTHVRDPLTGKLKYEDANPGYIPFKWKFACGEQCCKVEVNYCWEPLMPNGVRHETVTITPDPNVVNCTSVYPECNPECPASDPTWGGKRGRPSSIQTETTPRPGVSVVTNPVRDLVRLTIMIPDQQQASLEIVTMQGGRVRQVSNVGAGELEVDLKGLAHGYYQARLVIDGKTIDACGFVKE